jgi:hypothetical protein
MNILTVNLLLSTIVFAIAAKLYLIPQLAWVEPRAVVLPILLLHALRHLGLMFLAPGAVEPGIPKQFAYRRPSATSSPPCWSSLRLPQSAANRGSRGRSSAWSMSGGRSICTTWSLSFWAGGGPAQCELVGRAENSAWNPPAAANADSAAAAECISLQIEFSLDYGVHLE